MKKIQISLYLISIIIFTINCHEKKYNHSKEENNIYFVFSSFRHGARKPFSKVDIFGNKVRNPGKLTPFGKKQHTIIGEKNRKRYFNFLNLGNKNFDTEQIMVRSSFINRSFVSTEIQLQSLLNSKAYNDIIQSIKLKPNLFILYNINIQKDTDIFTYYESSCPNKRKLSTILNNDKLINDFNTNIYPLFKKCYGDIYFKSIMSFCDDVFSSYYEYIYESKTTNKIGKCGNNTMNRINNFCVKYYDSIRGWNEKNGYHFYTFFNQLFKYMKNSIEGKGKLKMIMIGGHDSSVDILMNYFDGMKIIKRTEYPTYAFNIVLELRKYNNKFYIEIYYNDILKYNQTLEKFKNTLDKSKYSDLNNYCKNFDGDKNIKNIDNNNKKIKIVDINNKNNKNIENNNKNKKTKNIKTIFKIFIIICLLIIIMEYYLFILKKRKKMNSNIPKENKDEHNLTKNELNNTKNDLK